MKKIILAGIIALLVYVPVFARKGSAQAEPLTFVIAGQSNANRIAPWVAEGAALYGMGPVMVLNCADIAGGSSIWDWQPDGFLFRRCISMITISGLQPDAVFFLQGERDAQNDIRGSGHRWRAYFLRMVAQFRAAVGNPDLIVLAGITSPSLDLDMFPQRELIRTAQKTLRRNPVYHVDLVYADELKPGPDGIHYADTEAYIYARKFLQIYKAQDEK